MKAYVIYMISDYARPLAITANKQKAEQYMKKCKEKDESYHVYWIDAVEISNNVLEFDCA